MVDVYWIKRKHHTDPETQGYVGVSKALSTRLQEHRRTKWFCETDHDVEVLAKFDDAKDAYAYEEQMRPTSQIGWNINKGGIQPPDMTGCVGWNKGRKLSKEHRDAICKGMTGHKRGAYGEAHRKAISDSLSGEKNPRYGKPAIQRQRIKVLETGIVYESQVEAAHALGCRQGDISNCLKGRQKSVRGYRLSVL
jgi:hypothetical protein